MEEKPIVLCGANAYTEKYYFNEDYYDFYLHKSENKTAKKNNKLKDDIGVAA